MRGRFLCQPLAHRQGGQVAGFIGGNALKVECLGLSVEKKLTLNLKLSTLNTPHSTLCAASIMPILKWMCYRKLLSACMRLTVRSLFKAVLQHVYSQFLSRRV